MAVCACVVMIVLVFVECYFFCIFLHGHGVVFPSWFPLVFKVSSVKCGTYEASNPPPQLLFKRLTFVSFQTCVTFLFFGVSQKSEIHACLEQHVGE